MILLDITNLTQKKINISLIKKQTIEIINNLQTKEKTIKFEKINISIALLNVELIRNLNKIYRKKDYATDILTFELEKTNQQLSGEILLCPEIIKTKIYQILDDNFNNKIKYLLAHGCLHLIGYDHKTKTGWEKMERMTFKII